MNNTALVPPQPVPSAPLAVITQAITASLDGSRRFTIAAQEAGHVLARADRAAARPGPGERRSSPAPLLKRSEGSTP